MLRPHAMLPHARLAREGRCSARAAVCSAAAPVGCLCVCVCVCDVHTHTHTHTYVSQKRNEKKRKETNKKEDDVEDELANQFNDTMNISTKRRRVEDV